MSGKQLISVSLIVAMSLIVAHNPAYSERQEGEGKRQQVTSQEVRLEVIPVDRSKVTVVYAIGTPISLIAGGASLCRFDNDGSFLKIAKVYFYFENKGGSGQFGYIIKAKGVADLVSPERREISYKGDFHVEKGKKYAIVVSVKFENSISWQVSSGLSKTIAVGWSWREKLMDEMSFQVPAWGPSISRVQLFELTEGMDLVSIKTSRERWRFEIEGILSSSFPRSPTVSNGIVYFGWDVNLYAVDAKSGEKIWKFKTGRFVNAAPAVSDGIVYFGSNDDHLYAVDAKTGKEQWRFKTGEDVDTCPAVVDGLVYFGSRDCKLYAVNTKTGKEIWNFKTDAQVFSSPAVSDGVVYNGSDDRNVYAVDAKTGKEIWRFKTGGKIRNSPAVSDGIVYFGSDDGNVYAVDAKTGEETWRFKTGKRMHSAHSPPAVSDGVVYFGTRDNNSLYAVDAKSGEELWRFETGDAVTTSPCVINGVVYFGSNDDNLYAVDVKTGKELWRFETTGAVLSSPAVVGGVVYFGGYGRILHALDTGE